MGNNGDTPFNPGRITGTILRILKLPFNIILQILLLASVPYKYIKKAWLYAAGKITVIFVIEILLSILTLVVLFVAESLGFDVSYAGRLFYDVARATIGITALLMIVLLLPIQLAGIGAGRQTREEQLRSALERYRR